MSDVGKPLQPPDGLTAEHWVVCGACGRDGWFRGVNTAETHYLFEHPGRSFLCKLPRDPVELPATPAVLP